MRQRYPAAALEAAARRRYAQPLATQAPPARTLGSRAWSTYTHARRYWWRATDRKRLAEADRRVVFDHLQRSGFLERFAGGRILEIGPKHGEDSRLLAGLQPAELVLLDLPEKQEQVAGWLPEVEAVCPARFVTGNLLYLAEGQRAELGTFDLVWCLGVVYHNVEQLRLMRRLFHLTNPEGAVVVESATTRDTSLADKNVVEVHWPDLYRGQRTITHLPSRLALKSWLEMVGYADVRLEDVYSRYTAWQRAVLTGFRPLEPSPYLSYVGEAALPWVAGDAT
jgi:2-polyprenyl-3-methyl-5-hydroxy-6-metoxy-1,4-benzoquinol methylase